MHTELQIHDADDQRLIDGLRQALNMNYARLLETAKRDWERHFAGKDPSDACVSVRVTSGDSLRTAGILRRGRGSLLKGNPHGLLA